MPRRLCWTGRAEAKEFHDSNIRVHFVLHFLLAKKEICKPHLERSKDFFPLFSCNLHAKKEETISLFSRNRACKLLGKVQEANVNGKSTVS